MSSETERFQAIRARWQAATPGPWCYDDSYFIRPDEQSAALAQVSSQPSAVVALTFERWPRWGEETVRAEDHTQTRLNAAAIAAAPTDVATLLAALDAAEARVTALQTALAQATHGYLHQVGEGTGYTVWHCRLCGDTTFDTHAPNHQSWCPVLVLADSYREE